MKKFKLGKDILILTIITLVTVLSWVSLEVWTVAHQTTVTKITQEQIAPLNPKINTEIIESLKSKLTLSTEQINQLVSSPPATPSSEPESPVENAESATESGQTATESSQTSTESAINN
jgi:hypothetical protein